MDLLQNISSASPAALRVSGVDCEGRALCEIKAAIYLSCSARVQTRDVLRNRHMVCGRRQGYSGRELYSAAGFIPIM